MLLEIANLPVRAFSLRVVKNLAFSISKNYFIYFNISFYNTLNIKSSIILSFHLNIYIFFFMFTDASQDQWIKCFDFGGPRMVAEGLQNKYQLRKKVGVNRPNTLRWLS